MSLRLRLSLMVTIILLVILIIGAVMTVRSERADVRAEVNSTMELVLKLMDEKLVRFHGSAKRAEQKSPFNLASLSGIRHLKIEYYDLSGVRLDSNRTDVVINDLVPKWFQSLMRTGLKQLKAKELPVYINTTLVGKLVIRPEPDNEIIEAWQEAKMLISLLTMFFIAVTVLLYVIVAGALKPIKNILEALTDIEEGHLDRRLPSFNLPEMTSISLKFNKMSATLQSSIESNHQLTQQLITLQEEERKNIAHELHDELGQHLTAINVDASVIRSCDELETAKKSAVAIDNVVKQMMGIMRNLLQTLRPRGLDQFGFVSALQELINNWQERHQDIDVTYRFLGEFSELDENIQVTLYRILQECLTNITRHSHANKVEIILDDRPNMIRLNVIDNGQGFDASKYRLSFGLSGMKERVTKQKGEFIVNTNIGDGVEIDINIPKEKREYERLN